MLGRVGIWVHFGGRNSRIGSRVRRGVRDKGGSRMTPRWWLSNRKKGEVIFQGEETGREAGFGVG